MKINKENFALITGAGSGIGKAIAYETGSMGKNLLLVSLPGEKLSQVAEDIQKKYSVKTGYFETDLSKSNGPALVHEWVLKNKYPVDFLVNNAGMAGTSVFEFCDDKYIDDRILVNIRALTFLSRYFIPELKKHPEAFILNVSSLSAFYSIPFKSLYSSTKAFVLNFSRALRTEMKESPVSISVLCPNGVRTNSGTHARIDAHGAIGKLTSIPVEDVARIAVRKSFEKKFLIIPGWINRVLLIIGKITPGFIQQRILFREFSKEVGK